MLFRSEEQLTRITTPSSPKIESNLVSSEEIVQEVEEAGATQYLRLLQQVTYQKWYIKITLVINEEYTITNAIALVDNGADLNCIQEGIVSTKYFEKTMQSLTSASGSQMTIQYKLSDVYICNQGVCIPSTFLLVRNLQQQVILGTPFFKSINDINKD